MNVEHKLHHSRPINSASNPIWMDGLRIFLGLFLFVKGILFLENNSDVFYLFSRSQDWLSMQKASMLTSTFHIVGGLMIAFGFLTRFALLCQFPILMAAVLLVNLRGGLSLENTELWLSLLATGLTLFLIIVGPGRYSVDHKILRQKEPASAD